MNLKRIFSRQHRELNKLASLPRYTKGSYMLGNSRVQFPDAASFVFIYKELFNEQIYKFNSTRPAPFIIDCGANIGLSVIYFKTLFPQARILAFEPEKKIFEYLENNIAAAGLNNITLINKAVWKNEEMLLFLNEGADASRISSVSAMDATKSTYEVQAVQLSKYLDNEVDFLKLDIEGAEVEVLKEIEPRLKNVQRIFIEFHSPQNGAQELETILAILKKNHFRYYIDSPFRMRKSPFVDRNTFLSFDFFLNIFAEKENILQP